MFELNAAQKSSEAVPESGKEITVTLNDGKTMVVALGATPIEILKKISNSLARSIVVAHVNGKAWDLIRPLEGDCTLEFFSFDTPQGRHCFWHSSAHVLGAAIELLFPEAQLCIGPPLEDGGFYYDVFLPNNRTISPADFESIQKLVDDVIKQKQPFQRLQVTKEQALDLFVENKFKQEIITHKIQDGETTTVYCSGSLVDLCRGPHVLNTGVITAMMITRNSSAYWNADCTKESLQRVYGMSFPSKQQLEEYKTLMKAAEERDHRRIGTQQQLFFFHTLSPGSCFFLPHGTRIYNKLQDFIRNQYRKRGYDEVITPNVYNVDLWKQSGHYQNYRENMFTFEVEGSEFAMKPMNCPGHCVLFGHKLRSYRELPLRIADFGVLHRNELSGALTGLTRVRRFQQDDAHIFCRRDQIESEVAGVLDMLQEVYGIFGFSFHLMLSTRPEKYLGEKSLWDEAEAALERCLISFCAEFNHTWEFNHGDGAFYGPKIDIQLTDALKRRHQCGTCQLDFQLPIRFGLSYKGKVLQQQHEAIEEANTISAADALALAKKAKEEKKAAQLAEKEAKAARGAALKAAHEAKVKAEAEAKANGTWVAPEEAVPEIITPAAAAATPVESAAPVTDAAAAHAEEDGCGCVHEEPPVDKNGEYIWKEIPLPAGHERPVMVHRAILGSVERMIAVLIEHTGGQWPLWLSPRQMIVVPLSEVNFDYAYDVQKRFHNAGFYVDIADSNKQFNKKIAEAASEGYNFILVVGGKESEKGTVNVRYNARKQVEMTIDEAIAMFNDLVAQHK